MLSDGRFALVGGAIKIQTMGEWKNHHSPWQTPGYCRFGSRETVEIN
jgi:hypothetical protein